MTKKRTTDRAKSREYTRQYRARHPERVSAQRAAIRAKERFCPRCKKEGKTIPVCPPYDYCREHGKAIRKAHYHSRREHYIEEMKAVYRANTWIHLVRSAVERARKKGLKCELNFAWGRERWTGRCELTGIAFVVNPGQLGPGVFSPSIDRIDPAAGYTKANSRFILNGLNALKSRGTDEQMYLIAEALIRAKSQG